MAEFYKDQSKEQLEEFLLAEEKYQAQANDERKLRESMRSEIMLHERKIKQLMNEVEDLEKYKAKKDAEVNSLKTWLSDKDEELAVQQETIGKLK